MGLFETNSWEAGDAGDAGVMESPLPHGRGSEERCGGETFRRAAWMCAVPLFLVSAVLDAQSDGSASGLRATIKPKAYQVPAGQPVWVEFSVENQSSDPITVMVPNTHPRIPEPEIMPAA
jgi:hypothetical protein